MVVSVIKICKTLTKLIKIIFCQIFLYIIFFKVSQHEVTGTKLVDYVVVHLDLKGTPPKLNYLESLLPVIKKYGGNGILIEYEDMFPYEGKLVNLSAVNCYKKQDLFKFISTAVKEGFEVIPLVQTFGHLENVLKLEEFKHLRESSVHYDSICPSKGESNLLIANMLSQVIEFHQSIHLLNYIHVGSDEVYHMNMCPLCKERKLQSENLLLQHVVKVSSFVKNLHPNIDVLIWDDMLRNMNQKLWYSHHLRKYVQPVYWDYQNLGNPYKNIQNYHKYFNGRVWPASAFKGADGFDQMLPNLRARFVNHFSWMKFMNNFNDYQPVKFKGSILTGWSRYSHFRPICDLLPSSIPSLMLSLIIVNEYNKNTEVSAAFQGSGQQFYNKFIEKLFRQSLGCNCCLNLPFEGMDLSNCRFKERNIYQVIKEVNNLNETCLKSMKYYKSVLEYYLKNTLIISKIVSKEHKLCYDFVNTTKTKIETALQSYYDNTVISQFLYYIFIEKIL